MKFAQFLVVALFVILIACESVPEDKSLYVRSAEQNDIYEPVAKPSQPFCGDKFCQSNESRCSCPADCGQCAGKVSNMTEWACVVHECVIIKTPNVCGNGLCEANEQTTCKEDCPVCEDNNRCTQDAFDPKSSKCVFAPLTPCCGNDRCEANEESTCLADCAAPLSFANYPEPFIKDGIFQAHLIVGSSGENQPELIIASISLMNGLSYNKTLETYSTAAKLDREMASITARNVILIGSPCQNSFVKELMPYTKACDEAIPASGALIRLFKTGPDTYAIAVMGKTGQDVRRAGRYLEAYKQKALSGYELTP